MHFSHYQRHRFFSLGAVSRHGRKTVDQKLSPARGEIGIGEFANGFERHSLIIRFYVQGIR